MMGHSHIAAGAIAGVAAAIVLTIPSPLPLAAAVGAVAALLPDIDHPGSMIGRRARVLSAPIAAIFGHRTITHSLFAIALVATLTWHLANLGAALAPAAAAGYASHVLADMVCDGGVPLFWPITRRRVAMRWFRTGGFGETAVALLCWTAVAYASLHA